MFSVRKVKDSSMKYTLFGIGISNIIIIFLIFLFIFLNGVKFFKHYSLLEFLFGTRWISLSEFYGLLPLLAGSFWVTIVALFISIPVTGKGNAKGEQFGFGPPALQVDS